MRSDTNRVVQPQRMAFGFRKKRNCVICVAKTKMLITAQLICVFVFAYAEGRFSHDTAHLLSQLFQRYVFIIMK